MCRGGVPAAQPGSSPEAVAKGAYVLKDFSGSGKKCIIIASGTEVKIAVEASEKLAGEGVDARVVSMPCWELYDAQSAEYKESVLPAACTTRVSVEAGSTMGWGKYVGASGVAIGLDRFGASAPGGKLYEEFGFTVDNVVAAVKGQ